MQTAKLFAFPQARVVRDRARRPLVSRRALQGQINAAAAQGYRWAVQDLSPYIAIAFFAGICVGLVAS